MIIEVDIGCGRCPCCVGDAYAQIYNAIIEYLVIMTIVVIREQKGME